MIKVMDIFTLTNVFGMVGARLVMDKQFIECKIVIIFLPICFNVFLGDQNIRLFETVLLSTHNICFGWEIKKFF